MRTEDERRNALLLLDGALTSGAVSPEALDTRAVRRAARSRALPPRALRVAEQALYKLRGLPFERAAIAPQRRARRAAGAPPSEPPRVLVRVDEFPHYRAWDVPERFGTRSFARFAQIMGDAGVPYLLAVVPRVSRDPLSPAASGSRGLDEDEIAALRELAGGAVSLALHGRDHRTRFASPRRHSELCGLGREQLDALLDDALEELSRRGIDPRVFVPPFNRFDARQLPWLARRFAVVCGGPESIGLLGYRRPPRWLGEIVYLPSYAPLYGHAAEILRALPRILERARGLWLPVVLHWGWESDAGWAELERLAAQLARYAVHWDDFLAAVERSRGDGHGPG